MTSSWNITRLSVHHLTGVVEVHLRAFPTFFLTCLGSRFLREFYGSFVSNPQGVGFVAEEQTGTVLGVVVGPLEPDNHFRRLLQRRWWAFATASLGAVVTKPTVVPRLLRAACYRGTPPAGAPRSLLSSIAVTPEARGLGIGAALVQAWTREAQALGSGGCYLTTDAENNDVVNSFYRNLGWALDETYARPEGRKMNRYVLDFAPRLGSQTDAPNMKDGRQSPETTASTVASPVA
jgi:ribosomal protein S18 acetylase RimI-like enzyme